MTLLESLSWLFAVLRNFESTALTSFASEEIELLILTILVV